MINFRSFKPDEVKTYHWPAGHVLQLLSHHSDFGGSTASSSSRLSSHFDYFPSYHITPDHWDPMTHIHLYCSWVAQHSCGQKLQQLPLDVSVFSKLYSDLSSILKDFRNADYNFKNTSSYLINQGNVVAYHFIPISSTLAVEFNLLHSFI